jgi:hypothetical protein
MRTYDVPHPMTGYGRKTRDTAHKTELARFKGAHITAEREGDELVIFSPHDEHGMPATTMTQYTATDKRPSVRTLADINHRNAAAYHKRG